MSKYLDHVRRENARRAQNDVGRTKAPKTRKGLKRHSKSPIAKIQELLWIECKRIIRGRYGNTCYTCGKTGLSGSSWQTGHFIPSSVGGASLRYHLNNLRPQCFRCNIDLSGNGAIFYKLLVEREGQKYVDDLFLLKGNVVKALDHYTKLLEEYKGVDNPLVQ